MVVVPTVVGKGVCVVESVVMAFLVSSVIEFAPFGFDGSLIRVISILTPPNANEIKLNAQNSRKSKCILTFDNFILIQRQK